jgi:hypothetical protein
MKKVFKYALLFAAAAITTMTFTACSSDDDDDKNDDTTPSANVQAIQALSKQYVENVVYPTYTNLANATEMLYDQLDAAKGKFRAGTLTQGDINTICSTFLSARAYWEASEAFLYGPATTFGIDPHIDTWPLDLDALAVELSNANKVAMLDNGDDGIAYAAAKLGQEPAMSPKSDPKAIKAFFAEVVPDYDEDRFYVSHMKKILDWYEVLRTHASLEFVEEEEEKEEAEEARAEEQAQ